MVRGARPSRFFNTRVFSPAREAQKAVAVPTMPPPMTITSAVAGKSLASGVAIGPPYALLALS